MEEKEHTLRDQIIKDLMEYERLPAWLKHSKKKKHFEISNNREID